LGKKLKETLELYWKLVLHPLLDSSLGWFTNEPPLILQIVVRTSKLVKWIPSIFAKLKGLALRVLGFRVRVRGLGFNSVGGFRVSV